MIFEAAGTVGILRLRSGWQGRGREPRCARLDSRGRLSPHESYCPQM